MKSGQVKVFAFLAGANLVLALIAFLQKDSFWNNLLLALLFSAIAWGNRREK